MDIRAKQDELVPKVFVALGVKMPANIAKCFTYKERDGDRQVQIQGVEETATLTVMRDGLILLARTDQNFLTEKTTLDVDGTMLRATQVIHPENGPIGSPCQKLIPDRSKEETKLRKAAAISLHVAHELESLVMAEPEVLARPTPLTTWRGKTSTPATRMLFAALGLDEPQNSLDGRGNKRVVQVHNKPGKQQIVVQTPIQAAELTIHSNGALRLLKTDYLEKTVERTSVWPKGHVFYGIKSLSPVDLTKQFKGYPVDDTSAEQLRALSRQAVSAVKLMGLAR